MERITIVAQEDFVIKMESWSGPLQNRSHAITVLATIGDKLLSEGNPEAIKAFVALKNSQ